MKKKVKVSLQDEITKNSFEILKRTRTFVNIKHKELAESIKVGILEVYSDCCIIALEKDLQDEKYPNNTLVLYYKEISDFTIG